MISIDKIRYNIGEYLWNFWQNNNDVESIKNAEKILRSEIEDGLRRRFWVLKINLILNRRKGNEVLQS